MNYDDFKNSLLEKAEKIQLKIEEAQAKKLYDYMQLLLSWNEKMNLTAITDPNEVIVKHFIDSFTVSQYIEKDSYMVDVGTGAGFPGIPLKIIRPDISIVLVDSLQKRVHFLEEVIQKLTLTDIDAIHSRIEGFGKNKIYREKFDFVTSRAVANLAVLSEYMLPLLKISGKAICMKGANVETEIEDAKKAIKILGGKIDKVETFLLPDTDMSRNIIIIKKQQNTPNQYPRKAGLPAKQPIL